MRSIHLIDEAATLALGARLGVALRPGDVVALVGDLGAGKTTLVRGLIQSQIGDVDVPSPTYTLIQSYDLPEYELWHCDLYRLEQSDDVWELGLIDAMETTVCLIEWPDRMGDHLPEHAKRIELAFDGSGRVAKLSGLDHV